MTAVEIIVIGDVYWETSSPCLAIKAPNGPETLPKRPKTLMCAWTGPREQCMAQVFSRSHARWKV